MQPGVIAGEADVAPTIDDEGGGSGGGSGGNGGGGGPIQDPLIAALIQKLPQKGPYDAAQRIAWLNLMTMAFQLTYGPVGDIEIRLKSDGGR